MKNLFILLSASISICNIFGAAELNYEPFYNSIGARDTQSVQRFMQENPQMDINHSIRYGITPLHIVASSDNKELAQLFLDNDADIEAKTLSTGSTPLLYAVRNGRLNMASLLLNRGADVNAANHDGTALHIAVWFKRLDIISLLLEHGVDIKITNIEGKTPAELAREANRDDIAELIEFSAIDIIGG